MYVCMQSYNINRNNIGSGLLYFHLLTLTQNEISDKALIEKVHILHSYVQILNIKLWPLYDIQARINEIEQQISIS